MRQITKDINSLKENDIINVLLYGLYKLSDNKEYASLAELIYVIDKDSLYKLCATYGGCTLKIPTLQELKILAKVLLIFQFMYDGATFEDACVKAEVDEYNKKEVCKVYDILFNILVDYDEEK